MNMVSALPQNLVLYFLSAAIVINFLLVLVLLGLNYRAFIRYFRKVDNRVWILLALIVLFGAAMRLFYVQHQHLRFIDEFWYMESARNFLARGKFELSELRLLGTDESLTKEYFMYGKQVGWPFLISLGFGLFGVNNYVPIYVSLFLGVMSVAVVFFVSYFMFHSEVVGLFSSLFLALFPLHAIYSASGDTVVPGLFFLLLVVGVFTYYSMKPTRSVLLLGIFLFVFSVQMRIDYLLIAVPLLPLVWYKKKSTRKHLLLWLLAIPFFISYAIQAVNDASMNIQHGQLASSNVQFIFSHVADALLILYNSTLMFLIPLTVAGITFGVLWKRKELLFLLLWLSAFVVMYPLKDVQDRILLPIFPVLFILASYGAWRLLCIIPLRYRNTSYVLLGILIAVSSLPQFHSQTRNFYRDDINRYALIETGLPNELAAVHMDDYIVTEWPTILRATTDLRVIRTSEVLEHPSGFQQLLQNNDVYFLKEMWCVHKDSGDSVGNCAEFMGSYQLQPELTYRIDDVNVVLYRVQFSS